jgi:hypothetical protein
MSSFTRARSCWVCPFAWYMLVSTINIGWKSSRDNFGLSDEAGETRSRTRHCQRENLHLFLFATERCVNPLGHPRSYILLFRDSALSISLARNIRLVSLSLELVSVENAILPGCVETLIAPQTGVSKLAFGHHPWSTCQASGTRLAVNISSISVESGFTECDFFV